MTRDDIIRMAREAGFNVEQGFLLRVTGIDEDLERFAALVAAAERERNDAYIKSLHESVSWQAERVLACLKALEQAVLAEREACAKVCDDEGLHITASIIRARGQE
jgi:hypothetical protein